MDEKESELNPVTIGSEQDNTNNQELEVFEEESVSVRKMFSSPFSPIGRISRLEYAITFVIYLVADILLRIIFHGQTSTFIILVLAAFFFMQGAKRCHDIGISGWWQLIPVLSWTWLFFAKGDEEENEYGDPPYYAVIDDESFTFTSAYLRANTRMSGGLIAFLLIALTLSVIGLWYNYSSYNPDDYGNIVLIELYLFLPSILALVWICYVAYAFIRRLPNAVFWAETYLVMLFLLKFVISIFWGEHGYDWGQLIVYFFFYSLGFIYLIDSRNVATVIPRNFRRISIYDILLSTLFFLISIGVFAIGVNKVDALYQLYQEKAEELIVDSDLNEGEYTDGIVAFRLPKGFTCEQESDQNGTISVLKTDSAYVVISSGFDSDESEINFNMNYCPNWEDKELKEYEQHEITNDRGELNGNTLFIHEKYYEFEDGVSFWRLILLFDSTSDKACVMSCYDNGSDDYLEPLLTSIRFSKSQ